jgi:hypothetical protein
MFTIKSLERPLTERDSRMPNKCLAPDDSSTQHDSMSTKKNIWPLTTVAFLVAAIVFGVCGCKTELMMKKTEPTPTPTPYAGGNARGPGPITH